MTVNAWAPRSTAATSRSTQPPALPVSVSIATLRVRIVQNCVELLQPQGYGDEPRDRAVVYRVHVSVADALPSQVAHVHLRLIPRGAFGGKSLSIVMDGRRLSTRAPGWGGVLDAESRRAMLVATGLSGSRVF